MACRVQDKTIDDVLELLVAEGFEGMAEAMSIMLNEAMRLELEFRRVCDGGNFDSIQLPFEVVFTDKKSNSVGLQLADLIARPIGLKIMRPEQGNRAYEVIAEKFYSNSAGKISGFGLKCFP